jgi:hypothetical protein
MFLYGCFRVAYAQAADDETKFRSTLLQISKRQRVHAHGQRRIGIKALARPEPDVKRLAEALAGLARQVENRNGYEKIDS